MSRDLRRLEELSLNSSAPPGQLLYDGWLLRLAPGKAKRARSVNAVYASKLALDRKIDYCEALYRGAGLPILFRLTPFSEPPELDRALERRGYVKLEPTAVEAAVIDREALPEGDAREMPLSPWTEAVGELRGSPADHRASHHSRLEGLALTKRAVAIEEGGAIVATGLVVVEDGYAGLFDIVTHEGARRRGLARRIVATLLRAGAEFGARSAYLQVESGNAAARRLYAQFGFWEQYLYWYRMHPESR